MGQIAGVEFGQQGRVGTEGDALRGVKAAGNVRTFEGEGKPPGWPGKSPWIVQAQELLEKLETERLTPAERVQERLQWEDWGQLLRWLESYAREQASRWRWRGEKGGLLPEGNDANSVAAEAIAQLLSGKGRLALGWTRERLERELARLVRGEISRLYGRKEAASTRSEWEVRPPDKEGRPRSAFDGVLGELPSGYEEVVDHEGEEERERVKQEFEGCLDGDEVGRGVFRCLCDGVVKRREIASRLGVDVGAVTAARKRLERQVAAFVKHRRAADDSEA